MVSIDCKSIPLALLMPAAIFAAPPLLAQANDDQDDYAGEAADRYAQVRVLEGEATIRKGEVEEALGVGIPVGEGDVVESRGRGVLQLGDGSRVAFDAGTRFTVAALFMDRKGERQVLLKLETGRLRISVGSAADTKVRVDSPLGSVSFGEKANVAVGLERQDLQVKVFSTRASVRNQEDQVTLGAGEWLRFNSPKDSLNRVRDFNTYDLDDFENWSGPRLAQRRSRDLERVPEEIRPYADGLSGNGDWVFVDETQSYCWRPRGVSQDWRPYWRGRWASYPGGMTWVSAEPWGYVTHHYGRWGWSLSLGWYWIPGIQYSPAWVAWQNSDAYFGWAPLGYHDAPCTWGYGEWNGGYCWNVVQINFIYYPGIHRHMHPGWRNVRDFGHRGDRPLSPAWRRTPLMVRPGEFRDPNQFHRVVQQRDLSRERMREYSRQSEQSTGRKVYRFGPRDAQVAPRPGVPADRPQPQRGFQERERQWQRTERPESRRTPGGVVPQHREQPRPQEGERPGRRVEPVQPRLTPGGVVPQHREQPRSQEGERPGRRVEPVQPRLTPGGVVPPHREQPRPQEGERPGRRVEPVQPHLTPGGVVPPHREQPRPQEGERPGRRGEGMSPRQNPGEPAPIQRVQIPRGPAEQRESRPTAERPAAVKEAPAQVKNRPSRDHREDRPKGER